MEKSISVTVGGRELTIETGKIAKQANGSVLVRCGDTVVLVVAVADFTKNDVTSDFLPLTVNYVEKRYAGGKIPGGFLKREGKLSDSETLMARLTDRPIRPLFPDYLKCPIDVVSQVLSTDLDIYPDMLSMIGASAALTLSDIPFNGPIGAVRVGLINGDYIANPNQEQRAKSDLDLVVAASEKAILMVEAGANFVSEEVMLEALQFAHEAIKPIVAAQNKLREECGLPKTELESIEENNELKQAVQERFKEYEKRILSIDGKLDRNKAKRVFIEETAKDLNPEDDETTAFYLSNYCHQQESLITRQMILERGARIGGRSSDQIRPISCEIDFLPRVHGSALFTRGETQAIVTSTLGTLEDEQRVDTLLDSESKKFYLHYNFPGYSVGENKRMGPPGRREIGHGFLAERALISAIPSREDFPYTVRIVSEITESNGSSSMASVCGGTLSLLSAGVPLKAPIAGIAMGLVKEGDNAVILTDILGDEDHLGDMDFKVCGSSEGITALQMDIKIEGISVELMNEALAQAKKARLQILDIMSKTIDKPQEMSKYSPRIQTIKIKEDKIRDLIGPGGKNIKRICEDTGVKIDIEDNGLVNIASPDVGALNDAKKAIELLTIDPQVNDIFLGKVARIVDFGAFVEIKPGTTGLVHISNLADERIEKVTDVVSEGDEIMVKVLEIDRNGRIKLSRKDALGKRPGN